MTSAPTTTPDIRADMTMEEVLRIAPAAHRALFQRYHVGGCSACGFQPTDTLARVCKDHNILDVAEVIRTIQSAQELETHMQVDPRTVQGWIERGEPVRLVDVRMPDEWEKARLPAAELLDYDDSGKYMGLPKDSRLVFFCRTGERSLDVAAYFRGHGFTAVRSLRGGLDAWRAQVDPTIPTYQGG